MISEDPAREPEDPARGPEYLDSSIQESGSSPSQKYNTHETPILQTKSKKKIIGNN